MAFNLGNLKVQMVAAKENFRDEELFVPEDIFSEAGAFVSIASNTKKTIRGMLGGEVDPDTTIEHINTDTLDALVIAGGSGSMAHLWGNTALLEKVNEAYKKGKVVAAICLSGVVLAQAGILQGKNATVYPTDVSLRELKRHGATFIDKGVVTDGNIVTAQGPDNAAEFANMVLDILRSKILA